MEDFGKMVASGDVATSWLCWWVVSKKVVPTGFQHEATRKREQEEAREDQEEEARVRTRVRSQEEARSKFLNLKSGF